MGSFLTRIFNKLARDIFILTLNNSKSNLRFPKKLTLNTATYVHLKCRIAHNKLNDHQRQTRWLNATRLRYIASSRSECIDFFVIKIHYSKNNIKIRNKLICLTCSLKIMLCKIISNKHCNHSF